ncbi:MAG: thioredoxin family protein [Winogradskyella sp.]|uniref:thioredoxin family protein n=1 Tax=Winogradskyella sp. TaxID=1883156 RepID=UPI0017F5FA42|nr:thioredoxin family protein [Winogradskyella sp.]
MRNKLITGSLERGMSYSDYRTLVSSLVREGSTTGDEKTQALINYTILNDKRMKRWDKTIKISEMLSSKIENFNRKVSWLVITESWCGDAAHILPVLNKVAELNADIDLKIVLRDENNALMHQFLTYGNRAIPKLIMIANDTNEVLETYGPRPSIAKEMVKAYKAEFGALTPEFKEDLQRWYNKDKGETTLKDLERMLSNNNSGY